MATTTAKRLAMGQITDATLRTIYTAPSGINTRMSKLGFTNLSDAAVTIDVYQNDGSTDFLQDTFTLPARAGGAGGKERVYWNIQRTIFNAGDVLKVQASTAITFNYSVHGSEIEV